MNDEENDSSFEDSMYDERHVVYNEENHALHRPRRYEEDENEPQKEILESIELQMNFIKESLDNINVKDESNNTILNNLLELKNCNEKEELIKDLVNKKADINIVNEEQRTPFITALFNKHISNDLIKYLLENKANLKFQFEGDEEERDALFHFLGEVSREMDPQVLLERSKLLLDSKCNPNYYNDEEMNDTFWLLCIDHQLNHDLLELFINYKAQINTKIMETSKFNEICKHHTVDMKIIQLL